MGSFCTNITLVGVDPDAVAPLLEQAGRAAYLGGAGGHTVVYDELGEAQDGSHAALAQELSAALGCVALASLNHDDDILYLQAFEDGEVRGEYNSAPDHFDDVDELVELGVVDPEPAAGPGAGGLGRERWNLGLDPARLVALVGTGDADSLAHVAASDAVFASDLHAQLVEVLGLPAAAVGAGYRYLERGEVPTDLDGLRRVGPG